MATRKKTEKVEPKSLTMEQVYTKYKEAMDGMYSEHGKWTVPYTGCEVVVGNVEDAHGREVQVKISIIADKDE